MINEECLARPTWEMAHLQTQVRRGAYKAPACERPAAPRGSSSLAPVARCWLLAASCFGRRWREVSLLPGFFPEMFMGEVLSGLVLKEKKKNKNKFLPFKFIYSPQSFRTYVRRYNRTRTPWLSLQGWDDWANESTTPTGMWYIGSFFKILYLK